MLDAQLLLRDGSTALTASETSASGKYMGPDGAAIQYACYVPQATGTSPSLALKIQEADDNDGSPGTWRDVGVFPTISAAGYYVISLRCDAPWRRYHATVSGTSPNFGNVVIAPELGGIYNKF